MTDKLIRNLTRNLILDHYRKLDTATILFNSDIESRRLELLMMVINYF